ncbi:related to UNR-interacting protein STRAP (serine-threonine kinase receptor-associated protein) [Ustilago bromivora]|uniref:Serine-threonine kinase receptor-associated protein n=1 Tax=Ustilago bromivora TaxID=307758 RepID=A0A1K0G554_9BASI|nr:related to UNR-interacting protein STRAP (serine-threonine kinase receptor-associated protein) [Ustilago bromivora]SPC64177.1 related to UNR-interacting protein STRAP (serine-threonine kinase receptor-associated protein) [Ustilago sp. UG-2017b]SYW81212.1 related to UNR-interacting protein STRAP (serine-threonine kinase receptor-associated protein) [Ustilago bromivora]
MTSTPVQKSVPLTCSGHTRPVVHLEFSDLQDDGTYSLLSSCKDGNPMLRDWLGDWVGTFLGHKGAVWCGKLSGGDASIAVTGSADFSAKVWDTFTGDCLHTFPHNHIVRTVAINGEGKRVVTAGHEKKLRLFDLNRPDAEAQLFSIGEGGLAHEGVIKSSVWHRGPAGESTVVSAGEDKVIRWWDTRTLSKTHEMSFSDPITSMERSSGILGELLTVTSGKEVYFIDALTREMRKKHTLQVPVSSASLHPTLADRFVAGSSGDGWVRIFDFESGKERELHKGHHGPAHAVSYSPDGELAASGSEDGTIRLWQTWPSKKYGLWT